MKIAILIGSISIGFGGLLFAATSQPIANGPSVLTSAQINVATPSYAGLPVVCSNCGAANAGSYNFCLSSGTGVGAFILISSAAAVTQCK